MRSPTTRASHHANVHRGVHTLSQEATALYEGAREKVRRFINAASTRRDRLRPRHDRGDQPRRAVATAGRACGPATRSSSRGSSIIRTSCPGSCSARRPAPCFAPCRSTAAGVVDFDAYLAMLGPAHAHRRPRPRLERARHGAAARRLHRRGARARDRDGGRRRAGRAAHARRRAGARLRLLRVLRAQDVRADGHRRAARARIAARRHAALAGRRRHDPRRCRSRARPGTTCRTASRRARRTSAAPWASAPRSTTSVASARRASRPTSRTCSTTRRRSSSGIDGLTLIGTAPVKSSLVSFTVEGIHPHDLGTVLDSRGVAVRTGHHCAMPVMEFFGVPGDHARLVRALQHARGDRRPARGPARTRSGCCADGPRRSLPRRDRGPQPQPAEPRTAAGGDPSCRRRQSAVRRPAAPRRRGRRRRDPRPALRGQRLRDLDGVGLAHERGGQGQDACRGGGALRRGAPHADGRWPSTPRDSASSRRSRACASFRRASSARASAGTRSMRRSRATPRPVTTE